MESIFREGLLKDRVAVITGGGSGINLRIAERFAAQGARCTLVGRTQAKLDAAVAGIAEAGGSATGLAADVRDYAALERVMRETRERFGEIDIVICGAAGNFPAPAAAMSANGFKSVVDIDLLGTFNTCRAAFEHLRKPGASVLSISATQSFQPTALQAHVCAAKSGVDMVMKVLAIEWGGSGVRLNSIAPGPVDDTEGMRRLTPTPEMKQQLEQSIPLGRYATRDEIADIALFLCSPAAAYITGAVLVADGGMSLHGSRGALGLGG
ncbi:MAG TPA: SDR family oxidoreductase [Candidatus Nanopelagicales bacterium]|nr:SDR family oxidoreductase [Candidatus Nanopelagicales bacterium]